MKSAKSDFDPAAIFMMLSKYMRELRSHVARERQLIVAEDGLYVRKRSDGAMQLYRPLEAGNPRTRSNDARVHQSGTFWIGTMGRKAEQGLGAIYALHRGEILRLLPSITIPNAICFSPDGAIGYFADTAENVLYRVALDPSTGLPTDTPKVLLRHRGVGGLDGAVVDADGCIWNARWGGGCVDIYSPQGTHLRSLHVPARQSSCPAFVGPGLSRLLVTSAWQDMDEAARRRSRSWPHLSAGGGRTRPTRAGCEARRPVSYQPQKFFVASFNQPTFNQPTFYQPGQHQGSEACSC